MVAYKLYRRDEQGNEHFIGMLPERRKNPERITNESLANWSRITWGENIGIDLNSIYFIQVEV
jgi:hypothetical protein